MRRHTVAWSESTSRRVHAIGGSVLAVLLSAPFASAADRLSGTWTSGQGAETRTYVFKMVGDRFTGIVCGRCDDPADVFEVEDGRLVDDGRAAFFIRHEGSGARSTARVFRERVDAVISNGRVSLSIRTEGTSAAKAGSLVLTRVVPDFELAGQAPPAPASEPGTRPSSFVEGHWVSAGRVAQQNWILKVRGTRVWGLVCGPCTPQVVAMVDGHLSGDTITFNINHIDTPVDATRRGIQRNIMTGTLGSGDNANTMRFKWVSEQAPDRTGEIVMFGPLR